MSSMIIETSPAPPTPTHTSTPQQTQQTRSSILFQEVGNIINTFKRKTFDLISPSSSQQQSEDINNNSSSRSLKRSKYYYHKQNQHSQQSPQQQQQQLSSNSIFSITVFSTKSFLGKLANSIPSALSSFSLGRSKDNNKSSQKNKSNNTTVAKDYSYYNRVDNKYTLRRSGNSNKNNSNSTTSNSYNQQDIINSVRLKKLLYRPKQQLPYQYQGDFNNIHLNFAPSPIKNQYLQQKEHQEQQQKQQQLFNNSHYIMDESNTDTDNNEIANGNHNNSNGDNGDNDASFTKHNSTPKKANRPTTPSSSNKLSFVDSVAIEKQNQKFIKSLDNVINKCQTSFYVTGQPADVDDDDGDNSNILSTINNNTSYNVSTIPQQQQRTSIFKQPISPYRSQQELQQQEQSFDLFNQDDDDDINNNNNNDLSLGDLNTSLSKTSPTTKYTSGASSLYSSRNSQYKNNLIASLRPNQSLNQDIVDRIEKQSQDPQYQFKQQVDVDLKKHRDSEIFSLLDKLDSLHKTNKWNILRQIDERIERDKNAKPILRPLSPKEDQIIDNIFKRGGDDEEVVSKVGANICTRSDIRLLGPGKWLNDEIINFYLIMLNTRQTTSTKYMKCHFFNTFFYQLLCNNNGTYNYDRVKKWTNSIDIFSLEKVILPIHLGNHWCCAVINFKEKLIQYYDSLLGDNPACLSKLRRYLQDEMKNRKKEGIINLDEFRDVTDKDIPTQNNGYDCGVFMCKFAEFSSRGAKLNFTQKDITQYRRRMALEILNKQTFD
ncbi:hypothetical protein CYY_007097 [Polysphondylium violaceum]|uniref:Ubiquitin-like protease family profile domain-containing protein n=1 Tax=Polysphondylium violaceum TaxID=133409 RepID=A0A8J4PQ64_9MYCE|nr:hypothetical protein CYY_007097 [Polysphondylium violaceum]